MILLSSFTGDITFLFELTVESMVWLDDFSNQGSLAYQQLAAKFQKSVSANAQYQYFMIVFPVLRQKFTDYRQKVNML